MSHVVYSSLDNYQCCPIRCILNQLSCYCTCYGQTFNDQMFMDYQSNTRFHANIAVTFYICITCKRLFMPNIHRETCNILSVWIILIFCVCLYDVQGCQVDSTSLVGRSIDRRQSEARCLECCSTDLCNYRLCQHLRRKLKRHSQQNTI